MYKYGLCRKHHAMLPWEFKFAAIQRTFSAYATTNRMAARLARKIERESA